MNNGNKRLCKAPSLKENKGLIFYCAVLLALVLLLVVYEVRADEPLVYKGNETAFEPLAETANINQAEAVIIPQSESFEGIQLKVEAGHSGEMSFTVRDADNDTVGSFVVDENDCDGVFHYYAFDEGNLPSSPKGKTFIVTATCAETIASKIAARPVYSVLNYNALTAALAVSAVLWCAGIVFVLWKNGFSIREEKVFLLLFIAAGTLYFIALPLFRGPDEESHFLRAFEISMGRLVSDGVLPAGLSSGRGGGSSTLRFMLDSFAQSYNSAAEQSYSYLNTALYSPVNYLPQAAGMFIARLFTKNIWVIGYAAKAANFISTGAILYFAIKYIPIGKNILLAVSLLPMSLQNSVVITADGLAYASAAALVSFVLYLRYESNKPLTKKQRVLLFLIPFVLSMCKIVYLPLCLLLFLIPKERFNSKKDYLLSVAAVGGMIIITNLAWLLIAAPVLETPYAAGADSPAQLAYLIGSPLSFLWACVKTVIINGSAYFDWMLGSMLGWLNAGIPWLAVDAFALCLIFAVFFDRGLSKEKRRVPVFLLTGCSILVVALTFMSLYIQFTEYKSGLVSGFQGRYLLPVLTPLLLSLTAIHPNEKPERSMNALYVTIGFMNVASALCVLVQTI